MKRCKNFRHRCFSMTSTIRCLRSRPLAAIALALLVAATVMICAGPPSKAHATNMPWVGGVLKTSSELLFAHPEIYWNPAALGKATSVHHILTLKDLAVMAVPVNQVGNTLKLQITLSYRKVARNYQSEGKFRAPMINLEFVDAAGQILNIEGTRLWKTVEFHCNDNSVQELTKLINTTQYHQIKGVIIWLTDGSVARCVM